MKEIQSRLRKDHRFTGKTILGSMCTRPHPYGLRIFQKTLEYNAGDAGLVPGLIQLEKDYIAELAQLLHGDHQIRGKVVSGGTEANILALWTARNNASDMQREVVLSQSAHFSFDKAADLLGLKLIKVPASPCGKVDMKAFKQAVCPRTMALVGIAGTTSLGICDPIEEIAQIAVKKKLYLHVDAAFGGFVYPFLPENKGPAFDFALEGVHSITIDPHKMGQAPIPTGCVLFRNEELNRSVQIHVQYLSGGFTTNSTLTGTRSGASIAAAYGLWKKLGHKGYQRELEKCLNLTEFFLKQIREIPEIHLQCQPEINVVGIKPARGSVNTLLRGLREKGWALSEWPEHIRVVIMPHVTKAMIKHFTAHLKEVARSL